MSINYQYADVEGHGSLLESQAGSLEAEHQAILKDLQESADIWGGVGSTGYQEFVTELNRNFQVIFQELHSHGGKVKTASSNTAHTDSGVGGTWSV
jgi:uncharacterized protein YukE